jgi:hypothetical protein
MPGKASVLETQKRRQRRNRWDRAFTIRGQCRGEHPQATPAASRVTSGPLCLHAVANTPGGPVEPVRLYPSTVSGLPASVGGSVPALMPGEGRDFSWKLTQEVTKRKGLAMSLATPESVQKLQAALHDKAKKSPAGNPQAVEELRTHEDACR